MGQIRHLGTDLVTFEVDGAPKNSEVSGEIFDNFQLCRNFATSKVTSSALSDSFLDPPFDAPGSVLSSGL